MTKSHQSKELILLLWNIVLVLADTLIFRFMWFRVYSLRLSIPFVLKGHIAVSLVFAVIYAAFAKIYGGFETKTTRASLLAYSHVIASVMTGVVVYVILWLMIRFRPPVTPMVGVVLLCTAAAVLWCKPAVNICAKLYPPAKTLIIYDNKAAFRKGEKIAVQNPRRFHVVGKIEGTEGLDVVIDEINKKNVEAVMLCGMHSSDRNDVIKYCIENDILAYIRPNIGDYLLSSAKNMQMTSLPVLLCQRAKPSPLYAFAKRVFDIFFALVFLIVTSPILLITAACIHFYDNGPVLYSQIRLTKDGREFRIYKFRSMRQDAEKNSGARLASANDDRITPVGKFIRATRIDELPQMINILIGDMSVVGPRPERPELAKVYEETMPEFSLRLQVKAGLTGYAQVNGKYNTSPYDKLQMDLLYISRQSIVTDLMICMETVKVVFMKESTEGIGEDETNAEEHE